MQSITITNSGGGTLTWQVGQPSENWLAVSPARGSDGAGASTPLTFSVDPTGLTPGTYTTQVAIIPSVGDPATIKVTLTVVAPTPAPSPSPSPSSSPPPSGTPSTGTPTATPTTGAMKWLLV